MRYSGQTTLKPTSLKTPASGATALCPGCLALGIAVVAISATAVFGSEDVPHRPFAQLADVPEQGQFIGGLVYEESEAYHIFVHGASQDITYHSADGEKYGIDINQGFLALQYGITERWAADVTIGGTTDRKSVV